MIPEETKMLLSVWKRHPIFFAALYIPAIAGVIIACLIYRPYTAFLFPLVWCYFVGSYLIQGITEGKLRDNHGLAIRDTMPIRFWVKVSIWSLAYILAAAWAIVFAIQENKRETAEQAITSNSLPAVVRG